MTDGHIPPFMPMTPANATTVTHVAAADGLTCRFCGADILDRAFYDDAAASDPTFQGHLRRHDGELVRVIRTDDPAALVCQGLGFWSGRLDDLPMDACTREPRAVAAAGVPAAELGLQPLSSLTFLRQVADEVAVANDDSVEVIAALTRRYLDASTAGVSVVDAVRRVLRIAALVPRVASNDFYVWQSLPLDRRFPGGAAVLNAATYALCTRAEILETFPSVIEYPVGDKAQALYCAPLIQRAEIVGTVFAAWDREHRLSDEQRETLRVLSTLAAHVFDK